MDEVCKKCNGELMIPDEKGLTATQCPDCVKLKLIRGRTYRAKKPRGVHAGLREKLVNDRTVIWLGWNEVQYDGPSVRDGSYYPKVTMVEFLKWADRDVTDELPEGAYASWPVGSKS